MAGSTTAAVNHTCKNVGRKGVEMDTFYLTTQQCNLRCLISCGHFIRQTTSHLPV